MLNGAHGCFPVTGHFYSPAKTYLCWIDLVTFLSFALVSHLVYTSLVCNLVQILSGYRCTRGILILVKFITSQWAYLQVVPFCSLVSELFSFSL